MDKLMKEVLICTKDFNNHECWTNPPTKNISEVWEFIYRMFDKPIKSFQFMYSEKEFINPKSEYIQGELF